CNMNVFKTDNLTKKHGSNIALDDISVTIQENTITGLIGRNGAGKTSLLKILAGFWKKTSGEVSVFNKSPFNNINVSANSILIDDEIVFPTSLTIGELLQEAEQFYPNWDM